MKCGLVLLEVRTQNKRVVAPLIGFSTGLQQLSDIIGRLLFHFQVLTLGLAGVCMLVCRVSNPSVGTYGIQ